MGSDSNQYRGQPHAPAVATAAAPSLFEGQQANLSMDLAGGLRLAGGGSAVTITGPLGSQAAATSVSVALASDQLPLAVTSSPQTSITATDPTQTTVGTSAATALAASSRKAMSIQNQGTTIIYVLLGAGTPTSSKYTAALPACGTINDGSSLPYTGPPGVVWQGAVQWVSSAGGGLATAVELS